MPEHLYVRVLPQRQPDDPPMPFQAVTEPTMAEKRGFTRLTHHDYRHFVQLVGDPLTRVQIERTELPIPVQNEL